jgi:cyclic dehypoxanthinyl futalosine synthase
VKSVLDRAVAGKRLSGAEAVGLFESASLTELGMAAGAVCDRLHPEPVRTYVVDRNINFTNICNSGCRFCAFFRAPGQAGGYVLSNAEVIEKIREAVELGATQIMMQGGLHPELGIEYYEELFGAVREEFPRGRLQIHSLSAPEVVHIAKVSRLDIETALVRLREAGLDSLPGGGAEILVDRVREIVSPGKATAREWLEVMETAGQLGMRATATMVFGHIETIAERVEHMLAIRELQDRTGVFTAFIPWTFQPGNTSLGGVSAGAHDYLRTLAISRLVLDNVENVQASWVTQGDAIAQVALRFGANDIGSTMIEENVVAAAGVRFRLTRERLIELIEGAGYRAVQRDTMYKAIS